jgi:hypothetical protein
LRWADGWATFAPVFLTRQQQLVLLLALFLILTGLAVKVYRTATARPATPVAAP